MNCTMLNNLPWHVCSADEEFTRNGDPYSVVQLSRIDACINAYVWPNSKVEADALKIGQVVHARLWAKPVHGGIYYSAAGLVQAELSGAQWLEVLPRALCPDVHALDSMVRLIRNLPYEPLVTFAGNVLAGSFGPAFITNPASFSYHHDYRGGLLSHCMDTVARFRAMAPGFTHEELAVGTIAALFHDVGKGRTLSPTGRHTPLGDVVSHEALTLEVCAHALAQLDREWPWASRTLRHIWAWRTGPGANWKDQPDLAIAVAAADRLSSRLDTRVVTPKATPLEVSHEIH